jgi:hypothetical protein
VLIQDFLNLLLDDALEDARLRNATPTDRMAFLGAEAAVAECRACMTGDRMRERLGDLLREARENSRISVSSGRPDQWFWFAREVQVEWIASVVSVLLLLHRLPVIVPPTRGAAMAAAKIAEGMADG